MRASFLLASCALATGASAFNIQLTPYPETCGNGNGYVTVYIDGPAMEPLTYAWSDGSDGPELMNVGAGTYSLTVTDFFGEWATAQVTVINQPGLTGIGGGQVNYGVDDLFGHPGVACPGACNGARYMHFFDGTAPYTVTWSDPSVTFYANFLGMPVFTDFCYGTVYDYTVTDAFGCPGSGSFIDTLINPAYPSEITLIEGACGGGANGAIEVWINPAWFDGGGNWLSLWQNGVDITLQVGYQFLGGNMLRYSELAPGAYEYRRIAGSPGLPSECTEIIPFVIEDLGSACGNVSGTLFIDHDQDCAQDANDPGVPFRVLNIEPGSELAITSTHGEYSRNLPLGSYTLAPSGSDLYPLCPSSSPVPFDLTVPVPLAVLDLADSSLVDLDLETFISAGPARPGFVHQVQGQVRNMSGQLSSSVDATFTFDPSMSFIGAAPTPTSVVGNVITWSDLPPMVGFDMLDFSVVLQVPPDPGLLGTAITHILEATQSFTEADPGNNVATWSDVITGSYDPNDKLARTSSGQSDSQYFIAQDEWIDYTIRFQNTGTDTAFTVVITDTLSAWLDMATFEQGAASHGFSIRFKPGRVVEWRFAGIALPDSTTDEVASHGFVTFRIWPQLPLLPGTVIENIANIYFDFNPPVITEPSVLVAEFSTGVNSTSGSTLMLAPNPASDRVLVSAGGATIADLRIFSMDGREVMRSIIRNASGVIDIAALPSGPYTVVVAMADDHKLTTHIIKL